MSKKLGLLLATTILVCILPSFAAQAWTSVKTASGYACTDDALGTIASPYKGASDSAKYCRGVGGLWAALTGTAQAAPLRFTLTVNPDGTFDTTYPAGDKPPAGSTLACDDSAAPSLVGIQTGNAYSADVRQYFSGSAAATATLSVVNVPGSATDATTQWSISSSGAGNNLVNAGSVAGSGALRVRGTDSGASVDCGIRNWSYVAPPTSDTTPPNFVTGINCTGASGSVTCSFDATTDPDDGVNRKGVATYRVKINGSTADTLTAPTAGLVNDFTGVATGSPTGSSATQGTGANGGRWTVATTAIGFEGGATDEFYGAMTAVAGTTSCVIGKLNSLTTTAEYGKAAEVFDNTSSETSARLVASLMHVASNGTNFIQVGVRPTDGGTMTIQSFAIATAAIYLKTCIVSNIGSVYYSADGGAWSTVLTNLAITLNNSHRAGFAVSGTSTGADRIAATAVWDGARVQTETTLSKTVSTVAGGTCTVTAIDAESTPNESTAVGSATCTPTTASGVHKWHPGYYVRAHTAKLNCGTPCDAQRHSLYAEIFNPADANIVGTSIWASWKTLESDSGGDFSAGFAWLHNEINFFKTNYPGKQISLLLDISPYGWAHGQDAQVFPTYFVNAGCTYDENSANSGGGSTSLNWFKTNPTCLAYFNRMIAAYGAEFDSEPALEYVRVQQETDDAVNNVGISGAAEDTAWKNIAQATVTAFPTTQVWIPVNWVGVETAANKESMLLYWKSVGAGAGNGDTQPICTSAACPDTNGAYPCPSTAWPCVVLGRNASIGGSSHNNCGEFVSMGSVELSEMGYNSVADPFGGLTSQQVATSWNNDTCQQYGEWEPNFGEIGTPDTMYWDGLHGQKWAIDTIPITHTTKPAGYN